jgi:hypothetical protein
VRTAVVRGCVVVSGIAGRQGDPHRLAVAGGAALVRASHLWGHVPGTRLELVAPGRSADYSALTGADAAAAVTLSGGNRWSEPVTVLRPGLAAGDPQVLASVLTHESVHVLADRAAARDTHGRVERDLAPAWLREGMAEYVSARSLGLIDALRTATRRATRHAAVPADFPTAQDLIAADPTRHNRAYDQAWLAVDLLVADIGLHRATAWHRAWSTASGQRPDRPAVDLRHLRRQWRTQLRLWHD